jgi:hypothetical protein
VDTRADRVALFGCLADPDTASDFFVRVADDVSWTAEGTHPLAGTYTSTTLEGASFDNHYCWVCRSADDQVGAQIVGVRAYLDSAMVAWTVSRNEA